MLDMEIGTPNEVLGALVEFRAYRRQEVELVVVGGWGTSP